MRTTAVPPLILRAVIAGAAWAPVAALCVRAQDSVSLTPGAGDALSPYGAQRVRYVVDGSSVLSSWGNTYLVAPVLKASRSLDPLFHTQLVGSVAVSPNARQVVTFPTVGFAVWSTPGAGVNPAANAPPGSMAQVSTFDRQFGVALTDIGLSATNVIGAIVGRRLDEPDRLYVTRVAAIMSRPTAGDADSATLTLGAIDAGGVARVRADAFNVGGPAALVGESVVRVDTSLRSELLVNTLAALGPTNIASDAAATMLPINGAALSLCTPSAIPGALSAGGQGVSATLAFDNRYHPGGGAGVTSHLAAGVAAQRGNPSYSTLQSFGGTGGVFACLAASTAGAGRCDTLNLFGVNTLGDVVTTQRATLPASLDVGGAPALDARFRDWDSQIPFRGPAGAVAIGRSGDGRMLAAATARDPQRGEFIALVDISVQTPAWTAVGHNDSPVLDGPAGAQIGKLVPGSSVGAPVGRSAPALDLLGNIYFVSAYKPNLGPAGVALIKAVRTTQGYRLERLLATGQIIMGRNSSRPYQIASLTLADSDSAAAGGFGPSSLLQPRLPGGGVDPMSPLSAGGIFVSAVIEYDNAAIAEDYDALLFIGSRPSNVIPGDIDGDGHVNSVDLGLLLGAWGTADPNADINGDGVVNAGDLALLLGAWG